MISVNQTILASGNVLLAAGHDAVVSRWIVSTKLTGGTYTIKPQKRISGTVGFTTPHVFADCAYTNAGLNSAAGGTYIAPSTTQTVDFLMDIEASGCEVQLVVTIAGGGSLSVAAQPLLG